MKTKGVFVKAAGSLIPQDERAKTIVDGCENGKRVLMWVHKARNPEHHRLAWGVFSKIGNAMGIAPESILLWLKYETGRIDYIETPSGIIKHPQSIAFESMGQVEFSAFWNEAEKIIKEKLLDKLPSEVFLELREMMK